MPTLEQLRSNRNALFWTLHAAGWSAYGITQFFGALLYEKPGSYAAVIAVAAVAGFSYSKAPKNCVMPYALHPAACSVQKSALRLDRSCSSVGMSRRTGMNVGQLRPSFGSAAHPLGALASRLVALLCDARPSVVTASPTALISI